MKKCFVAVLGLFVGGTTLTAIGADKLTLYCSPQIEWCELMVQNFEKQRLQRVTS